MFGQVCDIFVVAQKYEPYRGFLAGKPDRTSLITTAPSEPEPHSVSLIRIWHARYPAVVACGLKEVVFRLDSTR